MTSYGNIVTTALRPEEPILGPPASAEKMAGAGGKKNKYGTR